MGSPPKLPADWSEFLSLLISHRVKFVLVGGHAVAVHGHPRLTEDLDVFVEASAANAARLRKTLVEFGFGTSAPAESELARPDRVFMMGVLPFRIDVLTTISGVSFREAWRDRIFVNSQLGRLPFISRRLLLLNKRASGRPKDLADIHIIENAAARTVRRGK
jgi:hypothetical protein